MKIAISNDNYVLDESSLKAIDSSTINNGDVKCFDFIHYVYFSNAVNGIKPDDLLSEDKGRWVKRFDAHNFYSIVEDNHDFVANSDTDVSSIEMWDKLDNKMGIDYGYKMNEIASLAVSIGWSNLTNNEKDIVGYYYAVDPINLPFSDNEIITHYVITKGFTSDQAVNYHLDTRSKHVGRLSICANERATSSYLKKQFMYYFKDVETINNFIDAILTFEFVYRSQYLLGEGRGDTRVGLTDFFENTGMYSSGGGLKDYSMNVQIVNAYADAIAATPGSPTPEEIETAEQMVRDEFKVKAIGKLVYGKEL